MPDLDQLIKNIVYIRKKHNLNQSQFAEILNLNRPIVASYEQRIAKPSIEVLMDISEKFKIDIHKILYIDLEALEFDLNDESKVYQAKKNTVYVDINYEIVRLVKLLADAYDEIKQLKNK